MLCKKCKKEIADDSCVCPFCGEKINDPCCLPEATTDSPEESPREEYRPTLRRRIWYSIYTTIRYRNCCLHYVDKQRKKIRRFNRCVGLSIIVVSAIGGSSFFSTQPSNTPVLTSIITIILEILRNFLQSLFFQSEDDFSKIDSLSTYYGEAQHQLGNLWENIDCENDDSLNEKYDRIMVEFYKNEPRLNKLIHSLSKEEKEKLTKETTAYINRIYNNIYEEKTNETYTQG